MDCPFAVLQLNLWATRDQIDAKWLELSNTLGESVVDDARQRALALYDTLSGVRELKEAEARQQQSEYFARRRRIIELVQILYRQEYFVDENTQPSDYEGLMRIKSSWAQEDRMAAEDMFENGVGDCKAKLRQAEERAEALRQELAQTVSRHRSEMRELRSAVQQAEAQIEATELRAQELEQKVHDLEKKLAELENKSEVEQTTTVEEVQPNDEHTAENTPNTNQPKSRKRKQPDDSLKQAIHTFVTTRLTAADTNTFISTHDLLAAFKTDFTGGVPNEVQFSKDMRTHIHAQFAAAMDKRTSQARGYCGIRIV